MTINPIASSSAGNCYLISDGCTTLMLEGGISPSKLREKGVDLNSIDAILVTHEHSDHAKYVSDYLEMMIPVYATKETIEHLQIKKNKSLCNPIKKFTAMQIGTFRFLAFSTQHDAADPVGFYISSDVTKERLLFATDTYYIKYRFGKMDYLMVECNFSKEILARNLQNGSITTAQVKRIVNSHFEIGNVINFLKSVENLDKTKRIYLMHLSDTNSDEDLFKKEIEKVAKTEVIVCPKKI